MIISSLACSCVYISNMLTNTDAVQAEGIVIKASEEVWLKDSDVEHGHKVGCIQELQKNYSGGLLRRDQAEGSLNS